LPFCGYNMSDYFAHWLALGEKLPKTHLPKIFTVNWFRTDEHGKFIWPGFGENMRVLAWMLERVEGKGAGVEHVFGTSPRYADLNWTGSDFAAAKYAQITSIDTAAWKQELSLHAELFAQLKTRLPAAMLETKAKIEKRLAA
jgi:phosphoenolpyruvate carboxykinase (GTP)